MTFDPHPHEPAEPEPAERQPAGPLSAAPQPAQPAAPQPRIRNARRETRQPSWFWLLAGLVLPPWSVMVRYTMIHPEKLPTTGSFILAPNHYSEIDPVAVGAGVWHLGRVPRFLAKASLFRIPVVGWILRSTGQIPVERSGGSSSSEAIAAAQALVTKGRGVIIYPEGSLTRDPDLWPMRGKTGAVRLALTHRLPIIPAAHWGTQAVMPRYSRKIHPFPRKEVKLIIGDPIDLRQFYDLPLDQRTLAQATDLVMAEISRLVGLLRNETPPERRWDPSQNNQSETGKF